MLISADSHVIESPTLWAENLPPALEPRAPRFPVGAGNFEAHPAGFDPARRIEAMETEWVKVTAHQVGEEVITIGLVRYIREDFRDGATIDEGMPSGSEIAALTKGKVAAYCNGWRFNGQQYPNGLHMAVTRPQTQDGVAEAFASDLAEAVKYALEHRGESPVSGAIYGGVAGGMTEEADDFNRAVMADMFDAQQAVPKPKD